MRVGKERAPAWHFFPEPRNDGKESQMSAEEQVKKIIMEQLGVSAEEVKPEASFVEDLGADSLDLTELIMAMEEAFDVEIADEDAQKILKVKDAIAYVENHAN